MQKIKPFFAFVMFFIYLVNVIDNRWKLLKTFALVSGICRFKTGIVPHFTLVWCFEILNQINF